ncbi:NAD-dependent epimerase/dehydratase family protein [Salegentibacter sediminis]|uniref:NAD-dependent epimerase/dehydratase family protein n=1 Tax=Salegentibacter sediminis TaxID=1930251 RepID=UPI0009BE8E88|nr:NAD-dependent epimerase/dehydratase family protein [Salegentibacter sediminis]
MILITGATGLVGSHLAFELAKKKEKIRALFRSESKRERVKDIFTYYTTPEKAAEYFQNIDWVKLEINDIPKLERAFEGVEQVYHCAALVSFNPADAQELRKTNITGTANIVNLCIANKVKKLCHVSSTASLGRDIKKPEIDETTGWNPEGNHSDYAISKYGAEIEVWRGSQEGIPMVIVNPGIIIGPGFWDSGSGPIFSRIQQGLNYFFSKTTGFVGVGDVVSIMQLLMNSEIKNEKYVIVSENINFKRVMSVVAQNLNKPAPKKELKKWMLWLGWTGMKVGSIFGRKRQITTSTIKTLFEDAHYSNEKIKKELDYEFTPMEKVISKTAAIYKEEVTGSR